MVIMPYPVVWGPRECERCSNDVGGKYYCHKCRRYYCRKCLEDHEVVHRDYCGCAQCKEYFWVKIGAPKDCPRKWSHGAMAWWEVRRRRFPLGKIEVKAEVKSEV